MVFRAKFTCKAERITSASARCFAHPMVHAWIMQKRAFCGTFVRNLRPYRVPLRYCLKAVVMYKTCQLIILQGNVI